MWLRVIVSADSGGVLKLDMVNVEARDMLGTLWFSHFLGHSALSAHVFDFV